MTMPLSIPSEALVDRLRQALPTLMAVYAFGSQVHGMAGPDSDLDLAVSCQGTRTRSCCGNWQAR